MFQSQAPKKFRAGELGCALLCSLLAFIACDVPGEKPEALPTAPRELRDRLLELYESARDAGNDVPADAYDWARADIERIGDWEYEILRLPDAPDLALLERLNERGTERWEVFWMERVGPELRIFLKRPSRSYLRMLPLSDLGRLVPTGGSGGAD